jgi:hypothetical protein
VREEHIAFIFFDPENGGDMFLRNVSLLLTDYGTEYSS